MPSYWAEFSTLMLVHLQAVMLPGADFAMTTSQSLRYGRRSGILASLGIACGLGVHIGYTLVGVGLLFARLPMLITLVRVAGAFYLLWLAWGLWRSKAMVLDEGKAETVSVSRSPFVAGLLTNLLNPKATLFFLSIFTAIVSPSTPLLLQLGYGVLMMVNTALWFTLVAILISHQRIRRAFLSLGRGMNRLMALLFVGLAGWLLFSQLGS